MICWAVDFHPSFTCRRHAGTLLHTCTIGTATGAQSDRDLCPVVSLALCGEEPRRSGTPTDPLVNYRSTPGANEATMHASGPRILFLDSFTLSIPGSRDAASDTIGYGITASRAIAQGLVEVGYEVIRSSTLLGGKAPSGNNPGLQWVYETYSALLELLPRIQPQYIFCFHSLHTFPVEVRRIMLDLKHNSQLVGYTHGSHWDPTDSFRFERYPGLEMLDLANLHVMDRVFLVSQYMRRTLMTNIERLSPELASEIGRKALVVGLPIDTKQIDRCRKDSLNSRLTIVYNHSFISSKRPEIFLEVIHAIMRRYDIAVLFTRTPPSAGPIADAISDLQARHPGRVRLGHDLPIDAYYRSLWTADIQVSTASHESLGIATLEAMYTRNCCILPDRGSYPEISGGERDVLYDPNNSGDLFRLISLAIENEQRRTRIADHLRRLAGRYSGRHVAELIDVGLRDLPNH
jgi:glycosyltransferase involved in cell wall biosynthesis